jgi:hypothetical protein
MPYNFGEPLTNDTLQRDIHPERHAALEAAINDLDARLNSVEVPLAWGWWDYHVSTNPPPGTGEVRTAPDPVLVDQPMTVWLSARDDDGLYWQGLTLGMVPGDEIRLRGTLGAVQHGTILSTELTVPGPNGYATIVAQAISVVGQIGKTARVEVALIRRVLA